MPATISLMASCAVLERADHLFFGDFLRAGFDHHDRVGVPATIRSSVLLLPLLERRVDDVLAVDEADAHAGDRLRERDLGEGQRRDGAGDGEHVGVVLGVGRDAPGR